MKVLVIDVGGTHVKVLVSGEREPRKFASGPTLTAKQMVAGVKKITGDWKYDVVSIGFPGPVLRNRPVAEPCNLGGGWVGFDFKGAFGCPVKLVNDAAMQGLGSYRTGKDAVPGIGNRPWINTHRGRHRGAHGIRSSPYISTEPMRAMSETRRW